MSLLLVYSGPVRTEAQESLRIQQPGELPFKPPPEKTASPEFAGLLDPEPWNTTWAQPGFHPLGVTLHDYSLTQDQIDTASQTGCGLVRVVLPMESFIADADPDWTTLDLVVSRLNRAGFEVMPVLAANTPVREFYLDFCRDIAQRYGKSFRYYQLLDNINLKLGLYSRDYADLIAQARAVLVLNDPDALIVGGGIRGFDFTYLDMLARQGGLATLDILAFNLTPSLNGIEHVDRGERTEHSLPFARHALEMAREHGQQVWITSLAVSTCYGWPGVDQADQAAAYARGALYLGWQGVERIIFDRVQDADPAYSAPGLCTGLLDATGRPKASMRALKLLNDTVDEAYNVSPAFQYRGFVYQMPQAEDLLALQPREDLPYYDPLEEYMVRGIEVLGYWFYAPEQQEYRLIYWLAGPELFDMRYTLRVSHPGLSPLERYILLDANPSEVDFYNPATMLVLQYLPVRPVPGVVRFEVNEDGRPG